MTTPLTFEKLCKIIRNEQGRARRNGAEPTEIWLGPAQAEVLESMKRQQHVLNSINAGDIDQKSSSLEDVTIFGLAVHLMMKDGVRLGTTTAADMKI